MRILVHDYAGHPFQVQLSRALAARGHEVTHAYAASIQTPRGSLAPRPDDPEGLTIEGIGISEPFQKYSFFKRRRQEREYGRLIADRAERLRPDWVISGNTPSEPQAMLLARCRKLDIRFVSWVQDFYGIAVDKLLRKKLPILGAAVGAYYKWLDRRILRASHRIIVITEDFVPLVTSLGVAAERIRVIENWAPLDELPLCPRDNDWAREHDLSDKFVFLYSGTLGMKHNPGLLLSLAEHFRSDPGVRVVVISEGIGADWLAEKKRDRSVANLILLPYQRFERMPDVLASGDVLVAILEPDAGVFSVPSKVLTYLCAGRPILAAMPAENLAARTIGRIGAGVVVAPEDLSGFVLAGTRLAADDAERRRLGSRGRVYAEGTFAIDTITDAFERAIEARPPCSATSSRPARNPNESEPRRSLA